MRLIDKIAKVITIIAVAMLILSMFCRCTTTKYVPVTEYKDRVVVKTDSLLKTDPSMCMIAYLFILEAIQSSRTSTIFNIKTDTL